MYITIYECLLYFLILCTLLYYTSAHNAADRRLAYTRKDGAHECEPHLAVHGWLRPALQLRFDWSEGFPSLCPSLSFDTVLHSQWIAVNSFILICSHDFHRSELLQTKIASARCGNERDRAPRSIYFQFDERSLVRVLSRTSARTRFALKFFECLSCLFYFKKAFRIGPRLVLQRFFCSFFASPVLLNSKYTMHSLKSKLLWLFIGFVVSFVAAVRLLWLIPGSISTRAEHK